MNWTISEVKRRGNATFKAGYWKCVLVALVLSILSGGLSVGTNFPTTFNAKKMTNEDGTFNYFSYDITAGDEYGYDAVEAYMDEIASSPNFAAIVMIITGILIFALLISIALSAFLLTPLSLGCMKFFKDAGRARKYELGSMGFAFSRDYMNVVKIMFIVGLKTFLWTLLFIIPGIVKAYEYRMIPYILTDDPGIDMSEAFRRSKEMMTGNKWRSFLFDLSFIGWILLGAITLGILYIFYVEPYIAAADAELYLTLKGESWNESLNYGNQYSADPYQGGGTYGRSSYGPSGQGYGSTAGAYSQGTWGGSSYGHSTYDSTYDDAPASDDAGSKVPDKDAPFTTPY